VTRSKIIISTAIAFFILGLGWGIWSNRLNMTGGGSLIVLCPKTWLPPETTEDISRRLKLRIVQLDFDSWSEFVRLAANTQGKADVICFHSFLARDLIQSKFLEKAQLKNLSHFGDVSVDFLNLPFDPDFDYSAPLFWGVNGFVTKDTQATTWKSAWPSQGSKMSLLYPDLELLWRMRQSGLEMHEEDEAEETAKKLSAFVQSFFKTLSDVSTNRPDPTPEELAKFQYIQLSSGPAAIFLKGHQDWHYWMPTDGVSLWFGMVGIGSQSHAKSQAREFINELLKPERALALHKSLNHAVIQSSLDGDDSLLPMQKASFIRQIPLDRVRFPDLSLEVLPRWEHLISEAKRL
jgi:spermidine/putrescine-binding protein